MPENSLAKHSGKKGDNHMGHFLKYGPDYLVWFLLLFELHQPSIEYMKYERKQEKLEASNPTAAPKDAVK